MSSSPPETTLCRSEVFRLVSEAQDSASPHYPYYLQLEIGTAQHHRIRIGVPVGDDGIAASESGEGYHVCSRLLIDISRLQPDGIDEEDIDAQQNSRVDRTSTGTLLCFTLLNHPTWAALHNNRWPWLGIRPTA